MPVRKIGTGLAAALVCAGLLFGGCGDGAPVSPQKAETAEVSEKVRGEALVSRDASVAYSVPEKVSVLMYHMIGDIEDNSAVMTEENLRWQMAYLKENGFHPITMREFYAYVKDGAPLPEKPVCITFDDGYADNYSIVYPLMKEYGFPWTIFVITGDVGKPQRVTWDELAEMAESGTVTVASHTVTHPHLAELSSDGQREEIEGAQRALREKLGIENPWLCYPYGSYNEETVRLAKEVGIKLAVTMDFGRVPPKSDPYRVIRIWVGNGVDPENYGERLTRDDYRSL